MSHPLPLPLPLPLPQPIHPSSSSNSLSPTLPIPFPQFSDHFFNNLPFSSISFSFSFLCSHRIALTALRQEGSSLQDSPVSVELQPICTDSHFDRVLFEAQHLHDAVIIVWMASWCRKCIYLKPKLEKLAAEYYPRLQFYGVDVNKVSHKLVAHAGVTKMPTIQLWKDGKKQAEVFGGHKAYLVINEIQEMIENESTM